MKNSITILVFVLLISQSFGQKTTYTNLEEGLKTPNLVKHLNLSYQNIEEVPTSILQFKNLESLNLSHNNLNNIPEFLIKSNIKELDISFNKQIDIGKSFDVISQFKNLNKLDISYCNIYFIPYSIGKILSLRELDASHNQILNLPSEIKNLYYLKKLNLSYNRISDISSDLMYLKNLENFNLSFNQDIDYEILCSFLSELDNLKILTLQGLPYLPTTIDEVKQIRYLDLSFSNLEEIPSHLSKLDSLESIYLKNCKNVNYQVLFSRLSVLQKLNTLIIYDDSIKSFPNGMARLKIENFELKCAQLEYLPKDFESLENIKQIKITFSPKLNVEELIRNIDQLQTLETLEIKYCNLGFLPSNIEDLKNIKNLVLRGNNLTSIPYAITQTNLKILDVRSNPIETLTAEDLQEKMPNCNVIYDPYEIETNITKQEKREIKPPFPDSKLSIDYQIFTVNAQSSKGIETASGSTIDIPENAFVDIDGNPVIGDVQIKYREFMDPFSIFLAGIPMDFDQNGEAFQMQSGGMFEIRASQDGKELYPNPTNLISVGLKTNDGDPQKDVYIYNENDNNWENIGKDSITPASSFTVSLNSPSLPNMPEKPANIEYEYIYFKYLTPFTSRNFKFKLKGSGFKLNTKYYQPNVKAYPEMKVVKKIRWVYDGTSAKSDFKKLKKVVKRPKYLTKKPKITMMKRYKFKNVLIYANPKSDNYIMQIVYNLDTLNIPVFMDYRTKNPNTIQQKNAAFFESYQKLLTKRNEHWNKVDEEYNKAQEEYQNKLELYRKNNSIAANSYYFRQIYLNGFGYYNCDRIYLMKSPKKINTKFIAEDGSGFNPKQTYLLDFSLNSTFSQTPKNLTYDEESENSLIAISDDGVGIVGKEDFKETVESPGRIKVFSIENINVKEISIAELRQKLGI